MFNLLSKFRLYFFYLTRSSEKFKPFFRRPSQLKIVNHHRVKTFGYPPNRTVTTPKPIRCWKSRPNPKGSPKHSPNWFITNSTISAHRLPNTMQKAKPYGRWNTKHGAESVTKPFQTASKPTFHSASKVSITTKKAGCTTTVLLLQLKECWMKLKEPGI